MAEADRSAHEAALDILVGPDREAFDAEVERLLEHNRRLEAESADE